MKSRMGMRIPHAVGLIIGIAMLSSAMDTSSPVAHGSAIEAGPEQARNMLLSGTAAIASTPVLNDGAMTVR